MKAINNRRYELRFRVSKEERDYILDKTKRSYLSFTEYARRRMLDDQDTQLKEAGQAINYSKARFACDHDKELMRLVYRAYLYSKEMAKKELGQEWFDEAEKVAELLMKDWGYE